MEMAGLALGIAALADTAAKIVEYLHDVRDGGKARIRLSAEISALWLVLENVKEQAEGWSSTPSNISRKHIETLNEPNGALEQCSTMLNRLYDKCQPRKGVKGIVQNLKWSFDKDEVSRMLEPIHCLTTSINLAYAQSTLALLENVADLSARTYFAIDSQERQALLDWLSPLNFRAQQAQALAKWCPATIEWFLETPEYRIWLEGGNNLLWTPGLPGVGKSTLASVVVNSLSQSSTLDRSSVIGIYFNSRPADDENELMADIFGSLLKQLVANVGPTQRLQEEFRDAAGTRRPLQISGILQQMNKIMTGTKRSFLVIDGFDELPSTRLRVSFFAHLRMLECFDSLSIMLVSRPDNDIRRLLAPLCHVCDICDSEHKARLYHCENHEDGGYDICESCYSLGNTRCPLPDHDPPKLLTSTIRRIFEPKSVDIKSYVLHRFRQHDMWQKLSSRNDSLLNDLTSYIVTSSDSRFLIAKMCFDNIESFNQIREFKLALTTPLVGLDDLYDQALTRLNQQCTDRVKLAKETLKWITFAARDLSETELAQAVQYSIDPGNFDADDIIPASKLVEFCAGIVSFYSPGCVDFTHFSVTEYFEPIIEDWFPDARNEISACCLAFLQKDEFGADWGEHLDDGTGSLRSTYPFHRHASRYWSAPLRGVTPSSEVYESATRFLNSDPHRLTSSMSAYSRELTTYAEIAPGMSALHMATVARLPELVSRLLPTCTQEDLDSMDALGRTALHLAARCGQPLAVHHLLVAGATVNLCDNQGYTPLLTAVEHDDYDAVRTLLFYPAASNCSVNFLSALVPPMTPLMLAACDGSVSSMRVILEHPDVQINTLIAGLNALHRAILHRHAKCVSLLIQDGRCDVNMLTEFGLTPLQLAMSLNDAEAIIDILLECSRETDGVLVKETVDLVGRTPLLHAVTREQAANVRQLIQHGCSLLAEDNMGRNILHYAALLCSEDILCYLLDMPSEEQEAFYIQSLINRVDHFGTTPLLLALQVDNIENAKILLEKGADRP